MNIMDFPGWARSVYGFGKEDLKQGISPEPGRHNQQSGPGKSLWRQRGQGEQAGWQFMPIMVGGIQLWNPIIRLTARKTIVETPMVERDGSVKESVSLDDYIINIRGIIKSIDGLWPDNEIAELTRLWQSREAVPIDCALTSHFLNGNEYVVITNLNIPENPGKVESILYELECVSDIPFELELE